MEPVQLRYIIPLGKYQVIKCEKGEFGTKFTLQLPHSVTITADVPIKLDVRIGDVMTVTTEALADANTGSTPIEKVH